MWAVVNILVYPIGIPVYYLYVLYTHREAIQCRKVYDPSLPSLSTIGGANPAVSERYLQSILLLFEAYEPKYWYWEVIETIRRLMLTGVLVLIAQGSAVQIIVGISISVLFLVLYDTYQPFADLAVGRVEAVSQRQILCVFFLALLIKAKFGSVSVVAIDVCLVLAVCANVIFLLWSLAVWQCNVRQKSKLDTCGLEMVRDPPCNSDKQQQQFSHCEEESGVSAVAEFTEPTSQHEDVFIATIVNDSALLARTRDDELSTGQKKESEVYSFVEEGQREVLSPLTRPHVMMTKEECRM